MGFRRIVPRRSPVKQDPERVRRFLNLYDLIKEGPVPFWFFDETGVNANDKPRKVLAPRGSTPTIPYTGEHIRENVMGAVNPRSGQLELLVMPYSNTDTFQYFLDYMNSRLNGSYCLMILDNASWHKAKALRWGKVISIYLPPYSPNLNAIEPLWKVLKDKLQIIRPISNNGELQDLICEHLKYFIEQPEEVKHVCKISDKIN